jgi:hypothetical protein
MSKPDASRTLRFELNRLDLADMTVKPHTIKIVGPAPTLDIAGLCKRLRKPLDYTLHLYECDVDTTMANAADTLERQADEINRLRLALVEAGMRIETCPGADKSRVKFIVQKIRAAMTEDQSAPVKLSD